MGTTMDPGSGLDTSALFAHGGELAERMQVNDWTQTSLGPVEGWPQSLRTAVSICLASPLPAFIWWGESGATLYNDPARTILGAKHPAALGAPASALWPEIWSELQTALAMAQTRGATSLVRQRVTYGNGEQSQEHDLAFSCSPIFGDAGVEGVFASVTETMSSEDVRSAATASSTGSGTGSGLLESIFEAITDAVFIYDRNGKIVRMNAAARDLFDLGNLPKYENGSPEERAQLIAARDDAGNLVPADESGLVRLLRGETLTGPNALDVRLRLPTGRELEVNITGAPLIDETGAITGAVAISRDVTAHRQLEREAAERASLLEAVYQSAPDRISIFDETGKIINLNPAARKAAGPDRQRAGLEEAVKLYNLRTAEGRPMAAEELPTARALRGETVSGAEMLLRDAEGRDQIVLASSAPFYDALGQVRGAVSIVHDVTAQRQMEQQTRWQASMLERAHDAIFMWELHGSIIYWNRGAELLYGFTKDEAIGRKSHNLLHTRLPQPWSRFDAMLAREGEWSGELTHTTQDGRQVVVLIRMQVVTEPDGSQFVLEVSRDITERKALERAVAQRAGKLEAIFEAVADGLAIYDDKGNIQEWNSGLATMFEFERIPDYPGLPVKERTERLRASDTHGQSIATTDLPFMRAVAGETLTGSSAVDLTVALPSGRTAFVSASAAPLREDGRRTSGSVVIYRDVAERLALERRMREALHGLLAMAEELVRLPDTESTESAESADDTGTRVESTEKPQRDDIGVVIRRLLTWVRVILECDRVAIHVGERGGELIYPMEVVGLTPQQEDQWRVGQPQGVSLRATLPEEMSERLFAGEIAFVDYAQPPFRGRPNPYDVRVLMMAPMRIGQEMLGLLTLDYGQRDHTYSEEEKAFAAASARLAALAIERDHLLREREQARAEALALEQTNRRMNEFLGIASHELRTPLTSIQANVQIIERRLAKLSSVISTNPVGSYSTDTAREQLSSLSSLSERTERQMRRLNRLIEDLLDVTRIEVGKLEYLPERCDLVAITREPVDEQRAAWPERHITWESNQPEIPIFADRERIGQVITNYLTNALKYSLGDQPVAVHVEAKDGRVHVAVTDHGPGLTPEQQSGLFERFYRAPGIEQLSGSGVGLGLGLSICRTVIERHGGSVGVASAPGHGSTFWFELPLSDGD